MRIRILPNANKQWAIALVPQIAEFLKSAGFKIMKTNADATICIGGDGTILYHGLKHRLRGAVLGIGSRSSKICQITRDNWEQHIVKMLKNKKTEKRMMIRASIGRTRDSGPTRSGQQIKRLITLTRPCCETTTKYYNAINDVVIHTTNYRVAEIEIKINDDWHAFLGDGVIISTATGSSGYAYSAGAPILTPTDRKIIIAPICAYMREFRHVVVDAHANIEIRSKYNVALIIDGMLIGNVKDKTIKITRDGEWHYLLKR